MKNVMMYIVLLSLLVVVGYFTFQQFTVIPVPTTISPTPVPTFNTQPKQTNIDDRMVWNEIQTWREKENLGKYTEHAGLCRLADNRADQLTKRYEHITFSDADYTLAGVSTISENITITDSEYGALRSWLTSSEHTKTLRRIDYKNSCLRCKKEFCVQLFTY